MNEISAKADMIKEMVGRLKAMPIRELIVRVSTLEHKATIVGGFKCGNSSIGSFFG